MRCVYEYFAAPLSVLPGVGARFEKRLHRRGIACIGDLLLLLPRKYLDDRSMFPIRELRVGHTMRTGGKIVHRLSVDHKKQVKLILQDETGQSLHVRFFHSPFLMRDKRLSLGSEISVRGKVQVWRGIKQMMHPEWMPKVSYVPGWRPVYPGLAGLSGLQIAGFIQRALSMCPLEVESPLDATLAGYPSLREALLHIHSPRPDAGPGSETLKLAYQRLKLEEILVYLHLIAEKRRKARIPAPAIPPGNATLNLQRNLPYPLTSAQRKAWQDICSDFLSGQRMHRLVQGDVGAGKTWVAALAMACALEHGFKAALMAPTEVLAKQHYEHLSRLLAPLRKDVLFLSSSVKGVQRRNVLDRLLKDEPCAVVGTHALIGENVKFNRLGLAVVDEQHRFGVQQRWALAEKGEGVHLLAMTATPIPRSLALALYGDMDLTVMEGLPPGRKPVQTVLFSARKRDVLMAGIRRILNGGGSVYWIVPRIDEEEEGASVEQRRDELARLFPEAHVAGLHGQLQGKQKTQVLSAFKERKCRLLVSTTVVEVGVDVPEARLIVIEEAERYGLAQLHQLRGRVGRGREQSYCVLITGEKASMTAKQRLAFLCKCHNGIELAELDLKLRGAGDALGVNQSGEAGFRVVDPVCDAHLFHACHKLANVPSIPDQAAWFWRPFAAWVD